MAVPLVTTAKRLGWLAQPDFCSRCFWLQEKIGFKKPWAIAMPLYSSMDRIQKRVVEQTLENTGKVPAWLEEVGDIVSCMKPPHHSNFFYVDDVTGLKVRGEADLILKRKDGQLAIVDLKTSRSCGRDMLLPTYEVQQNAYALAAEAQGLGDVVSLHLAYMAIDSDASIADSVAAVGSCDLTAGFTPQLYPLKLDSSILSPLCQRHVELCGLDQMPEAHATCRQCDMILNMANAAQSPPTDATTKASAASAPLPTHASKPDVLFEAEHPRDADPVRYSRSLYRLLGTRRV